MTPEQELKQLEEQLAEQARLEEELEKKKTEVQKQKLKLEIQKNEIRRKLPTRVEFISFRKITEETGNVSVSHSPSLHVKWCQDLDNILGNTPGRIYKGENLNEIPVTELEAFRKKCFSSRDIQTFWASDEVRKEITAFLRHIKDIEKQPHFYISRTEDHKHILIEMRRNGFNHLLDNYDGSYKKLGHGKVSWKIIFIRAWHLKDYIDKITEQFTNLKVEWEEETYKAVLDQITRRNLVPEILKKEDAPEKYNLTFHDENFHFRPFQRVGLWAMDTAEGDLICADQMGLGKTAESIGYCMFKEYKSNIAVCPASLKENWRREVLRLTGIDPYICKGEMPGPQQIKDILQGRPQWIIINYDIFGHKFIDKKKVKDKETGNVIGIAEAKALFAWVELLNAIKPDIVIYDEGHKLKNTSSNRSQASTRIRADHQMFLTGTPILNRVDELYAYMRILQPGLFTSEDAFVKRYKNSWGELKNIEELRGFLKPLLIRRRKADVMKDLPPIERVYEWYELTDEAKRRYEKAIQGIYERMSEWDGTADEINITSFLAEITRCKQICAQDKVDYIADKAVEILDANEGTENNKVIIFTGFKATRQGIQKRLGHEAVGFDGDLTDKQKRMEIVDRFQNDDNVKFIVMTGATGGEGITLTKASSVIFADFGWTPNYHTQCEERCYGRLNDAHGATSYYVVAVDTVEESIQQLLQEKLKVIETVVDGKDPESAGKNMGWELLQMMKRERRKIA